MSAPTRMIASEPIQISAKAVIQMGGLAIDQYTGVAHNPTSPTMVLTVFLDMYSPSIIFITQNRVFLHDI